MRLQWLGVIVAVLLPTALAAQPAAQRPLVGIEEIEDNANTGAAASFRTMIESAISQTGRFRSIERSRLNVILAEQNRGAAGGPVASRNGGRVGGISGVDFLIYGAISSVGFQNVSDAGAAVGMAALGGLLGTRVSTDCQQKVATVSLDLKITDMRSGEVIYARDVDYQQKSATSCNGEGSINTPALLRGAADLVAANLVRAIYPLAVAAVEPDGLMLLNYGEGVVKPNDYLLAYSKGTPTPDPTNPGRMIVNRRPIGIIKVTESTNDSSHAMWAGGGPGPITPGQILEPMDRRTAETKIRDWRRANPPPRR